MPKPFKGTVAYEWQIGSWVFMWGFKNYHHWVWFHTNEYDSSVEFRAGKFVFFTDPQYRANRFILWLRAGEDSIW